MAEMKYGYSVKTDGPRPVLIRYRYGAVETYYPDEPGKWKRTPLKDNILNGGGDFVWYDDITEAEAREYAAKIEKAYAGSAGR